MAGAGYKLFNTGDVLTAAQVNTYLMQQTVMVFASSAARTSALSGVLAEGMVSYLQDTNTLEVYDGSAWVGATGDITGLTAGTGISISSATGPVPTITSDVATTFDAKGDLVVGTGADTFSKLTAGQNGESIVADSSTSTGLRYTAGNAVGNPVLNSAMQIWQRGTSFTGSGFQYAADRWQVYRAVTGFTASRQTTSDTTNLPNIQYSIRLQRDSGNTSTSDLYLAQSLESVNSIPFAGKTVTLSFYARAGANWSPTSGNLRVRLFTGTGTDQNVLSSGYTGGASPIDQNAALTTTWTRYSYSATLATTTTEVGIYFNATPVGTAGANDWAEITGVQIDLGSVPLPFRTYSATLAGELQAAQRYYQVIAGYQAGGNAYSTTAAVFMRHFPVVMRTAPTPTYPATLTSAIQNFSIGNATPTAVTTGNATTQAITFYATGATGLTAYNPTFWSGLDIALSSEL